MLHALTRKLDQLVAWHRDRGGRLIDAPCLHSVEAHPGERVVAVVTARPDLRWTLAYRDGTWIEIADRGERHDAK